MKKLFFVSILSLIPFFGSNIESAKADNLDCAGYPESRQFVDAQSWWMTTPGKTGSNFGHVHLGGCIPEREQHSVTIGLDVRVVLHNNPGKVAEVVLVTKTADQETTRIHDKSLSKKVDPVTGALIRPAMTCPVGTCEAWLHWDVPLSWFNYSGLQEIRYRIYVDEPDGKRMISSLNYQTYILNGKTKKDVTRQPYLRAKGWYTGAGYCEASLRQPLPDVPVGIGYAPTVAMVWHGTTADLPVTHSVVLRDANFHAGIPGETVDEANGPLGPKAEPVGTVPTVAGSGPHKLSVKADCDDPRGSTNSGILVFPFVVN